MRRAPVLVALAAIAVLVAAITAIGLGMVGKSPHATASDADHRVGALFFGDDVRHDCTGFVVASRSGDLVMTAAHCLPTDGTPMYFTPGYAKGAAPHGVWRVTDVFVSPQWNESFDIDHDYAVLRVAPPAGTRSRLSRVVGGGLHLGSAPKADTTVHIMGYPAGVDDPQRRCTTRVRYQNSIAAIDCNGLPNGTSGSPWVTDRGVVVGLIGGFEQGGCVDAVSYTPEFGADTTRLVARADSATRGDVLSASAPQSC